MSLREAELRVLKAKLTRRDASLAASAATAATAQLQGATLVEVSLFLNSFISTTLIKVPVNMFFFNSVIFMIETVFVGLVRQIILVPYKMLPLSIQVTDGEFFCVRVMSMGPRAE